MKPASATSPSISAIEREILLVEYEAAHDAFVHFSTFRWQVAAPVFTGVAVFWGFMLQPDLDSKTVGVAGLLISTLLTMWLLYTDLNRQIYLAKLHRIHEIEQLLGMWQHRQWTHAAVRAGRRMHKTFGLHGHQLDKGVYVIGCFGASIISLSSGGWSWWLLFPAPLVGATLIATSIWQRKLYLLLSEIS
jgi:hypothetical protein